MPNTAYSSGDVNEACWGDIYVEQANYQGYIECTRQADPNCGLGLCPLCCPQTHRRQA